MKREKINIVDEDNNLLTTKWRDEVDYQEDIYQSAALWVANSKGQVLLAQRKLTKEKDPGMWGPAVAGTVTEGETFEDNIYKEAEEEIGLTGFEFEKGPLQYEDTPRKHFIQWFFTKADWPLEDFTLQEEEVEKLQWIDPDELLADLENNPGNYVPSLPGIIRDLLSRDNA